MRSLSKLRHAISSQRFNNPRPLIQALLEPIACIAGLLYWPSMAVAHDRGPKAWMDLIRH